MLMVKGSSTWNRETWYSRTNHPKRKTGLVFCNPKDYEAISEHQLDKPFVGFTNRTLIKLLVNFLEKAKTRMDMKRKSFNS